MGKLTYILRNDRTNAGAHVILDGTDVHASHPKGEHRLITFKNVDDKAALAKFQDVIKQHFHPRDGWVLDDKKPGTAVYPEWPKQPSPEEVAAAAAAQKLRSLGYVADDDIMVIDLKKQRTVSDLEIALDKARGVETLWALTTAFSDGGGTQALFTRLHKAVPELSALFLDSPWDTLTRASATSLRGLAGYLEEKRDLVQLGATGEVRLVKPLVQTELTTLALCSDPIDALTMEQLAKRKTPKLATLHLRLCVEGEADPAAVSAVPSLLASRLSTFTVEGLPDVTDTITQLLAVSASALKRSPLPANVRLDGSCGDGDALVAAVNAWIERGASTLSTSTVPSKLELGEDVRSMLDDAALTIIDEKLGAAYVSPFAPEAHDPRAKQLWSILA
jgi:hypothetical protein